MGPAQGLVRDGAAGAEPGEPGAGGHQVRGAWQPLRHGARAAGAAEPPPLPQPPAHHPAQGACSRVLTTITHASPQRTSSGKCRVTGSSQATRTST